MRCPRRGRTRRVRDGFVLTSALLFLALSIACTPRYDGELFPPDFEVWEHPGSSVELRGRMSARAVGTYRAEALVLARERYHSAALTPASDIDLVLGWGDFGTPSFREPFRFRLRNRRFLFNRRVPYALREQALGQCGLVNTFPKDLETRTALRRLRPGDVVVLEGKLIDLSDSWWEYATSRSHPRQVGHGSQVFVWVERVEVVFRGR